MLRLVSRSGRHRRPACCVFVRLARARVGFGYKAIGIRWAIITNGMKDIGHARPILVRSGLRHIMMVRGILPVIGKATAAGGSMTTTGTATTTVIFTGITTITTAIATN